jgi:transcriptional regulator with XRE-family HTH domain
LALRSTTVACRMRSDDAKLFRERLRVLREAKGLTQGQLEEKIGKEANYITRVETGRIDTPPLDGISRIARELEVSMSDLFFFEGIDDDAETLRSKIHQLAQTNDIQQLRRFYRLMLVSREK